METNIFINKCKELVVEYFNSQADSTDKNGKIMLLRWKNNGKES